MKKYLFIAAAAMFALPSMAAEDAPKKMTSAEKKAAMLDASDKAGYEKSRMLFLAAIHANTLNPVFSGLDGLMGFVLLASR